MCWKYWTGVGVKSLSDPTPGVEISNKLGELALWARGSTPRPPSNLTLPFSFSFSLTKTTLPVANSN